MSDDFKPTKEEQKIIDSLDNEEDKKFVIENYKHQYEWEHSLDGVSYELGMLGVSTVMEVRIVRTVLKLPDKIKKFVYENCQFTSPQKGGGQAVCMNTRDNRARPWLIILSEVKPDKNYESIIAHEIAHAWLGHKGAPGLEEWEKEKLKEIEACFTAKQWGFVGSGVKVDKCVAEFEKRSKEKKKVR